MQEESKLHRTQLQVGHWNNFVGQQAMSLSSDRTAEDKIISNTNTIFTSVANTELTHYKARSNHPIPVWLQRQLITAGNSAVTLGRGTPGSANSGESTNLNCLQIAHASFKAESLPSFSLDCIELATSCRWSS